MLYPPPLLCPPPPHSACSYSGCNLNTCRMLCVQYPTATLLGTGRILILGVWLAMIACGLHACSDSQCWDYPLRVPLLIGGNLKERRCMQVSTTTSAANPLCTCVCRRYQRQRHILPRIPYVRVMGSFSAHRATKPVQHGVSACAVCRLAPVSVSGQSTQTRCFLSDTCSPAIRLIRSFTLVGMRLISWPQWVLPTGVMITMINRRSRFLFPDGKLPMA
jgi:hypothetical protein